MIKESLFVLALTFLAMAYSSENLIEVPFASLKESVAIKVIKAKCGSSGVDAFKVNTHKDQEHYELVCDLKKSGYSSSTPIRLINEFKYPKSIIESAELKELPELINLGSRGIKTKNHPWGKEYWWSTRRVGTTHHTYLCPKEKKHCYYVIHGGIERFEFSLKSLH